MKKIEKCVIIPVDMNIKKKYILCMSYHSCLCCLIKACNPLSLLLKRGDPPNDKHGDLFLLLGGILY